MDLVTYTEPALPTLLVLLSFLYFLQVSRNLVQSVITGAGLLGEIALGIIYGPNITQGVLLKREWMEFGLVLGYLGLVLLVFEGGLNNTFTRPSQPSISLEKSQENQNLDEHEECPVKRQDHLGKPSRSSKLRENVNLLMISLISAFFGILCPIALTFAFFYSDPYFFSITSIGDDDGTTRYDERWKLSAFVAGAALSSTSLGTTFYVLKNNSNAHNIDLASLKAKKQVGNDNEMNDLEALDHQIDTLSTPIHPSPSCTPIKLKLKSQEPNKGLEQTRVGTILQAAALIDDVVALVLLSVIKSLRNTDGKTTYQDLGWTIGKPVLASILFAVLIPLVTFLIIKPLLWEAGNASRKLEWLGRKVLGGTPEDGFLLVGVIVLSAYLTIAYYAGTTILLGAFLAGMTLSSLSSPSIYVGQPYETEIEDEGSMETVSHRKPNTVHDTENLPTLVNHFSSFFKHKIQPLQTYIFVPFFFSSIGYTIPFTQLFMDKDVVWRGIVYALLMTIGKVLVGFVILIIDGFSHKSPCTLIGHPSLDSEEGDVRSVTHSALPTCNNDRLSIEGRHRKTGSLWKGIDRESIEAALFLGFALVARGEIGILILQVAYSSEANPIINEKSYLVAIWAIALCTIIGPIGFSGLLQKHHKSIVQGRWGLIS